MIDEKMAQRSLPLQIYYFMTACSVSSSRLACRSPISLPMDELVCVFHLRSTGTTHRSR